MPGYITASTAADIVGRDSRSIIKRIEPDDWIEDADGNLVSRLWRRSTIEDNADRVRAEAVRGVNGHIRVGTRPNGKPIIQVEAEPDPEPPSDPAEVATDEPDVQAGAANEPAATTDTPAAQEPAEGREDASGEDQDVIFNRLSKYTTPGGMVFDQVLDMTLMEYMTKLSEERINAAIKALVAAGKIRFDSDDHVWITGNAAAA